MAGGRAAALIHAQIVSEEPAVVRHRARALVDRWDSVRWRAEARLASVDLAPDLAQGIGTRRWFRGLGTFVGLSAFSLAFWPGFAPLEAAPATRVDDAVRDEFRSQMIMPLALGGDAGRQMGPTAAVTTLKAAPERPTLQLVATLVQGDTFGRMLQRAGVGATDAARVERLVTAAMPLDEIAAGTPVDVTLGRRAAAGQPRPLDTLSFRARFDLALEIGREGGVLSLERKPIRVDTTPLRIRGLAGESLYRSMRGAGAPPSAVQAYLRQIGERIDLEGGVQPTDTFDLIVSYRRAATGERKAGELLYAGIERNGKPRAQLMRWGSDGQFFEASGVGEQTSGLLQPVPGRITSSFGMRRHPILGYMRRHAGMDFKAAHGQPIVAVTDGYVASAGRAGGCGNAVRLNHAGALQTRYCHLSSMAVSAGQAVRRGQVIGYVGSTGLSTGPHLHYEMYRNGQAINPSSVSFVTRALLSGESLERFRGVLARLKTVEAGAALADLAPAPAAARAPEPTREIDRAGVRTPAI
ncbi:peptidoglycan DD-metalloendopeptidase family protein [Altererythrobacter aerius]|uniref:Peptidoglycan DD-metalloendopeptidase family protein n=2 Tax=Tsuneonella aeria TaxID=1837929 RepID=A0A6I4TFF6_9SPHN|nr:M23 family metallopeptidase [Tsuneonella aeria]MXO75454.1 peptidoglycan DD-metalloendopeptidase family protein [Tsuneonella aeria]